ncbi:hypothetical protein [Stenotrophomonas sp.]|uniref:hypothetical protein n=1 Tax=Stenotrophomonas sp. TaxID=69392 RepID=UPI0028AAE865|nr:hypothetical protein [Stenotrophomonas sp.]
MLLGLLAGHLYLPEPALSVNSYSKQTVPNFLQMWQEAAQFAQERSADGLRVSPAARGARHFELYAGDTPVLLVDNSPKRMVIIVFENSREQVPDLWELEHEWWRAMRQRGQFVRHGAGG